MSPHIVVALAQAEASTGGVDALSTLLPVGSVLTALTTIFVVVLRKGSEGEDRRDKWAAEQVAAANAERDRFKEERDAERLVRAEEARAYAEVKKELYKRIDELHAKLWAAGVNPMQRQSDRDDEQDTPNG